MTYQKKRRRKNIQNIVLCLHKTMELRMWNKLLSHSVTLSFTFLSLSLLFQVNTTFFIHSICLYFLLYIFYYLPFDLLLVGLDKLSRQTKEKRILSRTKNTYTQHLYKLYCHIQFVFSTFISFLIRFIMLHIFIRYEDVRPTFNVEALGCSLHQMMVSCLNFCYKLL